MSHSLVKCWIHAIFGTKYWQPLIEFSFEKAVHEKIEQELTQMGCRVRIVNGMPDHVHSLFLLTPNRSISEVMQYIKGLTSQWINNQNFLQVKFAWQGGYAAYSVSESQVEKVFHYIKNQKQHHKHQTFFKELQALAKLHNLNGGIYD
jgi:putative transposase